MLENLIILMVLDVIEPRFCFVFGSWFGSWTILVLWEGRTIVLPETSKEAIFIRVNDPSLNSNIGKFQLPHIWNEVLARSPELHLK